MKAIHYLIVLLVLSSYVHAQPVFNKQQTYIDALKLKKISEAKTTGAGSDLKLSDIEKVLKPYGFTAVTADENPFFEDFIPELSNPLGSDPTTSTYQMPGSTVATNANASSWQASVVNGIANFMAGRFKQEVLHMGIDNLFKKIIDPETKDTAAVKEGEIIKALFPKTYGQIKLLYQEGNGSYYTADLLFLRQLAIDDLEQVPDNLIKNSYSIFPKLSKENPAILNLIELINTVIKEAANGRPLNDIITTVAQNVPLYKDSTICKVANTIDLISQALLDTAGSENVWVDPNKLSDFSKIEVRCFYGLLYQQLKGIPEFKNYLSNTDAKTAMQKMQKLILFVNKLNTAYKFLKGKDFDLKNNDEFISYIKEIHQVFSGFILTLEETEPLKTAFRLKGSLTAISSRYLHVAELFIQKDYQRAIPVLIAELGAYMDNEGRYSRTLAFVSQLATIQSAKDMEALLQAYSLPIGGSSVKRHSNFNLSVNGYVGFTGGRETAWGSQQQVKGNVGLTAPIGISSTFRSHFTVFASIIDLGSVVNVRLNNDTASYNNLRFEHFFSPGIGLYYNFKKLPVTVGGHFNYIPNLRTIKYDNGSAIISQSNTDVTRLNLSILIDIPFFTLYNKDWKK